MSKEKSILRKIAYWLIPLGIQNLLKTIFYQDKNSIKKQNQLDKNVCLLAKENIVFFNKHYGQRCFILATGPSINKQDLKCLKGEFCIGVSQFFLHKDIQSIAPLYHVLAPNHHPFSFLDLQKTFNGFKLYYPENMTYFFGHSPYIYSTLNFLKEYPEYNSKNQYFIDYTNSQPLSAENHSNPCLWDISKYPFQIRTVIYTALQIAIFMGFKKIYLLGCDHDYLQDTKRVTNHHFYKEEEGISDIEHLSSFTTERWFEEYYYRWQQYRLMREYAKMVGCKIFNATEGGMLDVFPRVSLKNIL